MGVRHIKSSQSGRAIYLTLPLIGCEIAMYRSMVNVTVSQMEVLPVGGEKKVKLGHN